MSENESLINRTARRLRALESNYHLAPSASAGARLALRWARDAEERGEQSWRWVRLAWRALERASKAPPVLERREPLGLGENPDLWYPRLHGEGADEWVEV